ncbi:MAG: hypothetical protein WBK97_07605 [Bacteroidales bacterium]|jgi:Zn-dependent protease
MILSTPGEWALGWLDGGILGFLEAMGIPWWAALIMFVAIAGVLAFAFLVPYPDLDRPT